MTPSELINRALGAYETAKGTGTADNRRPEVSAMLRNLAQGHDAIVLLDKLAGAAREYARKQSPLRRRNLRLLLDEYFGAPPRELAKESRKDNRARKDAERAKKAREAEEKAKEAAREKEERRKAKAKEAEERAARKKAAREGKSKK